MTSLSNDSDSSLFQGCWSITFPLEISRITSRVGYRSPRTSLCDCTPACGMPMTGPQWGGSSRLTGLMLPSPRTTGTSMPMLACGLMVPLVARLRTWCPRVLHRFKMRGTPMSWTRWATEGWDGCRGSTWFTTTAVIRRDSPKAFHESVDCDEGFLWTWPHMLFVPFQYFIHSFVLEKI